MLIVDIRDVNDEHNFLTTCLEIEVKYHHNFTAVYRSKIPKSFDEDQGVCLSTPEKCKTRSEAIQLPFKS